MIALQRPGCNANSNIENEVVSTGETSFFQLENFCIKNLHYFIDQVSLDKILKYWVVVCNYSLRSAGI